MTSPPRSCTAACHMLVKEILSSSRRGQLLPQWTLVFFFHAISHSIAVQHFNHWTSHDRIAKIFFLSNIVFICNIVIVSLGYTLLILLYRHSVTTIFNRKIPSTWTECMPSFCQHLAMLKPLEIMFRYLTRHLRMLPDILVLGETRCGTTTLCHQLSNLEQIHFQGPFCLWAHPEMDHKESFYFVGHYLGYVTPLDYRICFPLKLEKWWHNNQHLLFPWKHHQSQKPFLVFDGCAQYLTSPTAAYLIAEAYHQAGETSFPLLIACIRDPISQAISWWRYENAAMRWGYNMGLTEWNTHLRSSSYPPRTILDAVEFSMSQFVETSYNHAESLIKSMLRAKSRYIHLPSWAMTWPAGQMSVFGRSSKYRTNLERYERVFGSYFETCGDTSKSSKDFKFIMIIPTQSLSEHSTELLSDIFVRLSKRKSGYDRNLFLDISKSLKILNPDVRRNATILSTLSTDEYKDVDENEKETLGHLLYKEVDEFNHLLCS